MISRPDPALYTLSSIYNANDQAIADSLSRIAAGKRILAPGDDFAGYSRASELQSDVTSYLHVKQNILEARGFTDYAKEVGNDLFEEFNRLKELKELHAGASGDAVKQAAYAVEYSATIDRINDLISDSSYDGVQVYRSGVALRIVGINPENGSYTVTIEASTVGSTASIGEVATADAAAIQVEVNNAQTYVVEMESFATLLQRQLNLTDTVISSKNATISAITAIDEVSELSTLTALQVRQEATVSMLAQANIVQGYAAQLFGESDLYNIKVEQKKTD